MSGGFGPRGKGEKAEKGGNPPDRALPDPPFSPFLPFSPYPPDLMTTRIRSQIDWQQSALRESARIRSTADSTSKRVAHIQTHPDLTHSAKSRRIHQTRAMAALRDLNALVDIHNMRTKGLPAIRQKSLPQGSSDPAEVLRDAREWEQLLEAPEPELAEQLRSSPRARRLYATTATELEQRRLETKVGPIIDLAGVRDACLRDHLPAVADECDQVDAALADHAEAVARIVAGAVHNQEIDVRAGRHMIEKVPVRDHVRYYAERTRDPSWDPTTDPVLSNDRDHLTALVAQAASDAREQGAA